MSVQSQEYVGVSHLVYNYLRNPLLHWQELIAVVFYLHQLCHWLPQQLNNSDQSHRVLSKVQKKTQQEGDQEGKTNIGERERERDLIDRKVHHRRKPHIDVQDTCSPKPADEYARHVKEAAAEITKAYPDWARSTGGALEPWGQSGEWSYSRGPPYVKKLTLWKGAGVDQVKEGTLWRRVLGLNTAAGRKCDLRSCDHAMTGNSYLTSFDGLVVFSPARITLCSLLL